MGLEELLEIFRTGLYYEYSPVKLDDALKEVTVAVNQSSGSKVDQFDLLHYQFILSLLTNHDMEARTAMQRIVDEFGEKPERVGLIKSMYIEATEGSEAAKAYLSTRPPADVTSLKRNAVLSKSKGDIESYVNLLVKLLGVVPTDAEAWAELAEVYASTGNYDKAIAAYEEVILIQPYAYNIFARLGEIYHIAATSKPSLVDQMAALQDSAKHYARSTEIAPTYVRAWCGLYVVSNKIQAWPKLSAKESARFKALATLARTQLEKIVKESSSTAENLAAARKLLSL